MSELNAEQIKKALECCTRGRKSKEDRPCLDCPYNECNIVGGTSERQVKGTCQGWLMKDALALIKELTEVNEKLIEAVVEARDYAVDKVRQVRAYTVREMSEILYETFKRYPQRCAECCMEKVDQITKEILEDK